MIVRPSADHASVARGNHLVATTPPEYSIVHVELGVTSRPNTYTPEQFVERRKGLVRSAIVGVLSYMKARDVGLRWVDNQTGKDTTVERWLDEDWVIVERKEQSVAEVPLRQGSLIRTLFPSPADDWRSN